MDKNSKALLCNLLKQQKKEKYKLFQAKKAILIRTEFITIPKKYAFTLMAHENGIEDGKYRIQVTLTASFNYQKDLENIKRAFISKILEKYKGNTDLTENSKSTPGSLKFTMWDRDRESAIKYLNNTFTNLESLAKENIRS